MPLQARRWPATRAGTSVWQNNSPAAAVPPRCDRGAQRHRQIDLGGRPRSRTRFRPGARVLRSDVTRKLLLGVDPEERLPATAYTREISARVYDALRRKAAVGLAAGYTVIIDAVALTGEERNSFAEVARAAAVPFSGLWLEARPEAMANRIRGRVRDASDASPEILAEQLRHDTGKIDWVRIDAGGGAEDCLAAARRSLAARIEAQPHRREEAMRAPSASADSFAQTTEGATALLTNAKVANPQSAPAITRSRPTISAYWQMRCATNRGCSTKLVVESMTPGIRILSSGIFALRRSSHSCAWRGLAVPPNDNPLGNIQMVGKSQAPMFRGEKPGETRLAPGWSLERIARTRSTSGSRPRTCRCPRTASPSTGKAGSRSPTSRRTTSRSSGSRGARVDARAARHERRPPDPRGSRT